MMWLAPLVIVLLGSIGAIAQEHLHPDATYSGAVARFYETWMRPDSPNQSCCNKQDCEPVQGIQRNRQGRWVAKRGDGTWLEIPDSAIEQRRDSPDGRSHICSHPITKTVFCFVHGAGG